MKFNIFHMADGAGGGVGGAAGVGGGVGGATGSAASGQSGGGGGYSYNGNYSPSFGYGNTGFNQGQQSSITGQNSQNAQSAYGVNGYAPSSAPVTNGQVQGALGMVPGYGTLASQLYGIMNPNQQGIAFGVGGTNTGKSQQGPSATPGGSGPNYQNQQVKTQSNNAGLNAMATDQAISDSLLNGSGPGALDMFTGEGKRSTLASQQQGINTQWGATNPELYTANSGKLASRLAEQNAGDIARNAEAQAANMALSNARTAGLNPAQAALLANQSGQNVYGQTFNSALAQGLHDYLNQYNTATNTRSGLLGVLGQNASQQDQGLTAQDWLNAAAGVAGVASNAWNNSQTVSDKNMKEKIKGNKTIMDIVSSRMGGKQFNYKDSETPVIGVMAQDMEKTPLKESVIDGKTKMVDTNNLSKQNIELLVSSLATIKDKLGRLKELVK